MRTDPTRRGATRDGITLKELERLRTSEPPPPYPLEDRAVAHQVEVVKGLIAMRVQGYLQAVHAHENLLAIEMPGELRGSTRRITWATAERLVQEFRARGAGTNGAKRKNPATAQNPTSTGAAASKIG